MAVQKVLARDWGKEINTGTLAVPIWTPIGGLKSLGFDHSDAKTDLTDHDSAGMDEHLVAGRGATVSLEGFFLEDPDTGTRDTGQAAVEALAAAVGQDSLGQFRLTTPGGTTRIFMASATLGGQGGGNNDATSWSATLTRSGAFM